MRLKSWLKMGAARPWGEGYLIVACAHLRAVAPASGRSARSVGGTR